MKNIKNSLIVAIAATALVTAQNSHAMLTSAALKGLNGLNKLKSANSLSTKNLKSLPTMSRVRFSDKSANSPKFNFNLSKRQDETLAPQTWSGSTSKLRESAVTLWERLTGKKSGQTSADLEAAGKKSEKNSNNGDESTQHQSSFVAYKIAQAKSSLLAALGLAAGVAYCENEDEQQNQASSDTHILNDAPNFDSMNQLHVEISEQKQPNPDFYKNFNPELCSKPWMLNPNDFDKIEDYKHQRLLYRSCFIMGINNMADLNAFEANVLTNIENCIKCMEAENLDAFLNQYFERYCEEVNTEEAFFFMKSYFEHVTKEVFKLASLTPTPINKQFDRQSAYLSACELYSNIDLEPIYLKSIGDAIVDVVLKYGSEKGIKSWQLPNTLDKAAKELFNISSQQLCENNTIALSLVKMLNEKDIKTRLNEYHERKAKESWSDYLRSFLPGTK